MSGRWQPGYGSWAYDEVKEGKLWEKSLEMVGLKEQVCTGGLQQVGPTGPYYPRGDLNDATWVVDLTWITFPIDTK